MTKNVKKNEKKTVAEIVTQRFIDALNGGVIPWVRPWEMWSSWSRVTGNDYRGANLLTLSGGEYVTFKQAKEQGITINKGAKSEMLVKYTEYKKTIDKDDLEKAENIFRYSADQIEDLGNGKVKVPARSIKYYNVFNVESCTDAKVKHDHKQPKHEWQPLEKAEEIANNYCKVYGVDIEHGGNQAYNRDNTLTTGGHVQMPKREQFSKVEEYYSTLFHELTHSTADQVKRDKSRYHADKKARAREELVAEIGAAYIMSFLGIESEFSVENSNAYARSWAKALKSDPNAILWAAPKAIEAAELILSASPLPEEPEKGEKKKPAKKEKVYTKAAEKAIERILAKNLNDEKTELLSRMAKVNGGYIVSDGFRAYRVKEKMFDVMTASPWDKEKQEKAAEMAEKINGMIDGEAESKCKYFDYDFDLDAIKGFIKEHKYTCRSKKVDPYIVEYNGVKYGLNPIYLKETIEIIGTTKARLPEKNIKPAYFESDKGAAIVLPIRLATVS